MSSSGKAVRAHQVRAREVLVGGVDAVGVLARDVDEIGEARARRDVDGVEALLEELVERERLADDRVELELARPSFERLSTSAWTIVLRQAELGDAIDEDAARLVECLEDDGLVAVAAQVAGAREAGWAGADDRDAAARRRADRRQLDAALLALPVGEERLDLADRHREAEVLVDLGDHAVLLALALLRTDAPADRRQEVGLLDAADRAPEVAVGHEPEEPGHVHADRAARHARLVLAREAAHRLGARLDRRVGERHLAGVADALARVLLGPEDLRQLAALLVLQVAAAVDPRGELLGRRVDAGAAHRAARSAAAAGAESRHLWSRSRSGSRSRYRARLAASSGLYMACRRIMPSKSTWCPSNSGPSTQT